MTPPLSAALGERTVLPGEIVRFGWPQTARRLQGLGLKSQLRKAPAGAEFPFVSGNGSYILDCGVGPIGDPAMSAAAVKAVPGVIAHRLVLGMANVAIQVDPEGIVTGRERPR